MKPPEGRIRLGDHVRLPDGRTGRVAAERIIQSNGAWKYVVAVDAATTVEVLDFELTRVSAGTGESA
jgi:hypothetical protein